MQRLARGLVARVLAPTDHGQIELGDQTVGERHAGESGEAQGIARFAHHDARTLRQGALTASIAANPAFGHGIVQNIDGEGRTGADDQRPGEQGVRGQRNQLQGLDVRPHDRTARGEGVGGGTGGRGDDDAVRAERVHLHIVHADGQFDHLAPVGAFQRDVVQRPILNGLGGARQPDVHMGDHAFVDRIVVGGDPADRLVDLEAFEFGQEADMPHVHAENRHLGAVDEFGGAQNRAVAAQNHDDFGVVRHTRRPHAEIRGLGVVDDRDLKTGHTQLAHRLGHYGSGLPEPGMRHHHRVALGHGILLSIRSHCSLF